MNEEEGGGGSWEINHPSWVASIAAAAVPVPAAAAAAAVVLVVVVVGAKS